MHQAVWLAARVFFVALAAGVVSFVAARFDIPGRAVILSVSLLTSVALVPLTMWLAITASFARLTAGRPTLRERAPADLVASVFILPLTSALTGLAITLPTAGLELRGGTSAGSPGSLGWLAFEVAVLATVFAMIVPVVALNLVVDEREGRRAALFDLSVSQPAFEAALAERWRTLRESRRRWLAAERLRALGNETTPPPVGWPRHVGAVPSRSVRALRVVPWVGGAGAGLSVAGVAVGVAASAGAGWDLHPTVLALAVSLAPTSLIVLAAWLHAYRLLMKEQGQADLLRLALSERPVPTPETKVSVAERWGLLKRAVRRRR